MDSALDWIFKTDAAEIEEIQRKTEFVDALLVSSGMKS